MAVVLLCMFSVAETSYIVKNSAVEEMVYFSVLLEWNWVVVSSASLASCFLQVTMCLLIHGCISTAVTDC